MVPTWVRGRRKGKRGIRERCSTAPWRRRPRGECDDAVPAIRWDGASWGWLANLCLCKRSICPALPFPLRVYVRALESGQAKWYRQITCRRARGRNIISSLGEEASEEVSMQVAGVERVE